ncbi:hypothetical protein AB0C96_02135 [Streptomyces sp. NPDC048506]|uniref:hypothetical protein n=1 Tax=Streptomyces sp. NPDC048506 TaxID=3155028 RepID=UPI00342CF885
MADEGSAPVDPELPVVQLCVWGMQAEAEGRAELALGLFQQAWDRAVDDYEACIAAHYLARHQNSPKETLRWNQECLDRADRVGDERVQTFYPSLYLNMAHAHRSLGRSALAHDYFLRAAQRVGDVPDGPYGDWNRFAIAEGLRGTAPAAGGTVPDQGAATTWALDETVEGRVRELLSRWCARSELKALGLTLPAYLGYLGTDEDRMRLRAALHMVHAARWLPEDEQAELGALIEAVVPR